MNENVMFIIGITLGVCGTLSPVLTYTAFFQLKEWRVDRLREHVKREGWWTTCFGRMRPIVGLVFLVTMIAWWIILMKQRPYVEGGTMLWMIVSYTGFLSVFSLLSIGQIIVRKQRYPVWTAKAVLSVLLSLSMAGLLIAFVQSHEPLELLVVPIIVGLPIVIVALAWVLLMPLDRLLKHITIKRAQQSRRQHPNLTVIGITGSVGKTTTKELLAHLLQSRGAIATPRHVNTEMGVARWLTKVLKNEPKDSRTILIVEMGAYRQGEIALLASIAQPTIGILTYVGRQHLALFGSEENIADGKSELLDALPSDGRGYINADSPLIDRIQGHGKSTKILVGTERHAALRAENIEETSRGVRFDLKSITYEIPLAGTHMVTNVALAIATAQELGISTQEAQKKLATFQSLGQTFTVSERGGYTILNSTYNSSPESFVAALQWAEKQPMARKVLICDGIIELGDREASIHSEIARRAKEVVSDVLVVHRHFLPYFQEVFGDRAKLFSDSTTPELAGSLLIFIGRMPTSVIEKCTEKQF